MQFLRIIKHDLEEGIWEKRVYFLLPVLLSLFSCSGLHTQLVNLQKAESIQSLGTIMDYWIYMVQGSAPFEFDLYELFTVPTRWVGLFLFLLISLNGYLNNDLKGWGIQVLTHSKSRLAWWLGKVAWCVLYTIVYFAIYFFIIFLFSFSNGAKISLQPTADIMQILAREDFALYPIQQILCITIIQPFLLALFFGLLQMAIGLYIKPILSFVALLTILLASAYWQTWLLPGNWGMPNRTIPIFDNGFLPSVCIALLLSGILICIITGYFIFKKKDILEETET
ncbi:hypothetical protein D7V86_19115 [bacterium D16-51]|nr:hypothetical protein D7V96_06270 [bacterium D16-59]RKI56700.1 hypothetical protein D7V86_19115 [bacterium D16-51]